MRSTVTVLVAVLFAAIVAVAAFFASLVTEGPVCPPCTPPGPCSLVACIVNVRGAETIAALVGVGGLVLALLVLRRWMRPSAPDSRD
jgi:hypothetical protein